MPIKVKTENVTPSTAREYLKHNIDNRAVRDMAVDEYAGEMRAGRFGVSPDVIAFDEAGNLFNGQHRLLAVVQSGATVELLVGRGWPAKVNNLDALLIADVTDAGRKRTVSDQLHRMHGVQSANLVAASARSIAMICSPGVRNSFPMGRAQGVLALYQREIEETMAAVGAFRPLRRAPVIGSIAFALKVLREPVATFIEKLAVGEGLKKGDPALTLRNHLMGHNAPNNGGATEIISEWVGSAIYASVLDKPLVQIKRGALGMDFIRGKQRSNVEKVRAIMGAE